MPTRQINGLAEVEKRVQASLKLWRAWLGRLSEEPSDSRDAEKRSRTRVSLERAINFWTGWLQEKHEIWDGQSERTFLMAPDQNRLPHCMYKESVQRPAGLTDAELRVLQRHNASEEARQTSNAVWLGHKSRRPAKTQENRQGWSLEDITEGSYVCFQAGRHRITLLFPVLK